MSNTADEPTKSLYSTVLAPADAHLPSGALLDASVLIGTLSSSPFRKCAHLPAHGQSKKHRLVAAVQVTAGRMSRGQARRCAPATSIIPNPSLSTFRNAGSNDIHHPPICGPQVLVSGFDRGLAEAEALRIATAFWAVRAAP